VLAAFAISLTLFFFHARGVGGYLLSQPSSLDGKSARLWASHAALPLLAAAMLWAIGSGLGRRASGRFKVLPTGAAGAIAAAALGLGLFAQAVFVLACAGKLNPGALSALAIAAAVLAVPFLSRPLPPRLPAWNHAQGAAAGLLAYAAICATITALAPPVEWDVLAYHLALPELYLKAGSLFDTPWMIHSHWPRLMEVFYSLPLAAGSDGAAALIHTGAAVLFIGAVAASAGSTPAAWTAALMLTGQPALLRVAGAAHADAATALFVFAAAYALSQWEDSPKEGWLIVGGMLAGLAVSAKLLGVAAISTWTLVLIWKSRRPREALLFAGAGLLMILPWLWTTWKATGDPVWPFLRNGPEAAELAARYLRSNRWDFPPPASIFTHDGPGFLVLPALGLLALSRGRRAAATAVERWLWTAAPLYAAMAWRHNEAWRFLMPVWPALALTAGRAACGAFEGGRSRRAAAAALVLASALPAAALSPNNALFAVLGLRSTSSPDAARRALFTERSVDVAGFYREARSALPPGAKVLLFREVRGYGAGFDYLWGDPMNQTLIDYRRIADPDALALRLKSLGITHVLDHPGSHLYREDPGYYDARTLALMTGCLKRRARPVLTREGLTLHELL
jgi:hypothetical protein